MWQSTPTNAHDVALQYAHYTRINETSSALRGHETQWYTQCIMLDLIWGHGL